MLAILDLIRMDDAYANKTVILNFCTAIGAFGCMPNPPKILKQITRFWPLQWLLVAVLVYQGGGEQDFQLAVEVTLICFVIYVILRLIGGESIVPPIIEPETFKSDDSDKKK